jgi:hypothetical protein
MALIRATAATAIPTVRQLATDLTRWIKGAGCQHERPTNGT